MDRDPETLTPEDHPEITPMTLAEISGMKNKPLVINKILELQSIIGGDYTETKLKKKRRKDLDKILAEMYSVGVQALGNGGIVNIAQENSVNAMYSINLLVMGVLEKMSIVHEDKIHGTIEGTVKNITDQEEQLKEILIQVHAKYGTQIDTYLEPLVMLLAFNLSICVTNYKSSAIDGIKKN